MDNNIFNEIGTTLDLNGPILSYSEQPTGATGIGTTVGATGAEPGRWFAGGGGGCYRDGNPGRGGGGNADGQRLFRAFDIDNSDSGKRPYLEYTVAGVGYSHDVSGVASANIGNINGIATANISKVNGA